MCTLAPSHSPFFFGMPTMPSTRGRVLSAALLSIALTMTSLTTAQSIPMDYCATINTGSGSGNHSDWQSDGLCSNFCKASKHGLAIVKGNLCWCSNLMPDDNSQVGTDKCRNPCPGFPADVCGGEGTWGYMRIGANPITGTVSTGPGSTTSDRGSTATGLVQDSKPPKPPPTTILTTTITALPSQSITDSAPQQQTRPPQVETVTADGTTSIITVVPTGALGPMPLPNADSGSSGTDGGGAVGTGAAVGIAIGVIAICAAGGITGFMVMRRKRRLDQEAQEASISENHGADMSHPTTGFASRRPTNGTWGSEHSSGRRSSMPDPRMKSSTGLYGGTFINRSHDSFESMQDNLDYSRPVHHPTKVLRVANPSEND